AYLSAVLVLCKTLGALIYGVVLIPLVRWASLRLQLRIATLLVMVALAYPLLRVADVVPTQDILGWANTVSAERAESLKTRFDQEKLLLTHAWDRKWFGWGRFGRSRVYFDNGEDRSITDGEWINTIGTFGLIGFAAEFGLLGFAVLRAAAALKSAPTTQDAIYATALTLIIAINIFDLIPNSTIFPWTWLLVGALLGRVESLRETTRQWKRAEVESLPGFGLTKA